MATRTISVKVKTEKRLETWNTRFGKSPRIVERRQDGKIVSHTSISSLGSLAKA